MTTEDEFQAMLDAHPDDHATRLVFADWLQDNAGTTVCDACCDGRVPYCSRFMYGCEELGIKCECNTSKICDVCRGAGTVSDGRRERAEGYRAMGSLRLRSFCYRMEYEPGKGQWRFWWHWGHDRNWRPPVERGDPSVLPREWWKGCQDEFATRREAEDAAAIAFSRLPAGRRAELLNTHPVEGAA